MAPQKNALGRSPAPAAQAPGLHPRATARFDRPLLPIRDRLPSESAVTQETTMDAHDVSVTQLIAQLQTYLEDLRAGP